MEEENVEMSVGSLSSSPHGPGIQFNLSGGNQNYNTGTGNQFPGATFYGDITFNESSGPYDSPQSVIHRCQRSLFFSEMEERYKDVVIAKNNTYEWLHQHESYREWDSQKRGLLWINGKPGSGKSTLMRCAFDTLMKSREEEDSKIFLSFFCHGRGNDLQKSPYGLYRALLHQLLHQAPEALQDLVAMFEHNSHTQGEPGETWKWNENDLKKFFESAVSNILKNCSIWMFVDAIDECGKKPAVDLSKYFVHLLDTSLPTSSCQFHICFSCRHYPTLALSNVPEICMEHENKKDISTYVRTQLAKHVSTAPVLLDSIIQRAEGVFMWACLVARRVEELWTDGENYTMIEEEIRSTPPDLEDLYTRLVQDMKNRSASLRLIRWICFAIRPLSLEELRWAMVIDADLQSDKKFKSLRNCRSAKDFSCVCKSTCGCDLMERKVKALSCGLIEVVKSPGKQIVQFIHQSTQDFFVEKGLAILDEGFSVGYTHYLLSRTCLKYLTMKEIRLLPYCAWEEVSMDFMGELLRGNVDDKSFFDVTGHQPGEYRYVTSPHFNDHADRWMRTNYTLSAESSFLHYAVTSWMKHAKESEIRNVSQDDLLKYFNWPLETLVRIWAWLYRSITKKPCYVKYMIHALSLYQLMVPLQSLLHEINSGRYFSWDVFFHGGNSSVYINFRDFEDHTALSRAAKLGHYTVVQLLLQNGADTNAKDYEGGTALHYAASHDQRNVAQLLLQHGAEVDVRDRWGYTPLSYVCGQGLKSMAELLIKHGANVNTHIKDVNTPLMCAAMEEDQDIVDLLRRHGASSDFGDSEDSDSVDDSDSVEV